MQYGTIIMVAITSIYMTQISFNIVKNNTVTQSNYIIKGMNLIMLAIVGKYLVNESLTCMKIFALFLIFVGILLLK
jgi:multidrug transporter EmrE-like cation transporter